MITVDRDAEHELQDIAELKNLYAAAEKKKKLRLRNEKKSDNENRHLKLECGRKNMSHNVI